jgi:hypothetical protein
VGWAIVGHIVEMAAGGVHCTIADYTAYAGEILLGLQGLGQFPPIVHQALHTKRVDADRAVMSPGAGRRGRVPLGCGWATVPSRHGQVSNADWSGGTFYARIVVAADGGFAFAGLTKAGSGEKALSAVIRRVRRQGGSSWRPSTVPS